MSPCDRCLRIRDASVRGHIECVIRLRRRGKETWDPQLVLSDAALRGHVPLMEYAVDSGASWSPDIMRHLVDDLCAGRDVYDAIDFARSRCAPWNSDVADLLVEARRFGPLEHWAPLPPMNITTLRQARHVLFQCCRTDRERRLALDAMHPAFVYWLWGCQDLSSTLVAAGLPPPGLAEPYEVLHDYVECAEEYSN